jgi:hypothetical protein
MFEYSYDINASRDLIHWAVDAPIESSLQALHQLGLSESVPMYDDLFLYEQVPHFLSCVQPRDNHNPSHSIQAPWTRLDRNQNENPQLQYGTPYTLPAQLLPSISVHENLFLNGPGTSKSSSVVYGRTTDICKSASTKRSATADCGSSNYDGSWSCAWPRCTSRCIFKRLCDLRKHYRRHSKTLFCRHKGCLQAIELGFSSNKDRLRHEAKHNPAIPCEREDCGRIFSRADNMVSAFVTAPDYVHRHFF